MLRNCWTSPGAVALLALTTFPGVLSAQATDPGIPSEITSRFAKLLSSYEQYGFSGSVVVSHDGQIVFEGGYGFANRQTGERNTVDTRFDFASIAKTFTGAAVLALESEGELGTDDRLEKHLGAFPDAKSAATVHHLATHTAGLAHRSKSELDYSSDRATYVQSMKDAPFESDPGSSYRYSNAGTSLLAAVVEEVAGQPYENYVDENLFKTAGLTATRFFTELKPGESGLALGYTDETSEPAPPEYDEWTWGLIGSTGVVSTVKDIHRWFTLLHSGRVLPAAQTAKAFDRNEEEAFGWHTEVDDKGRTFIHKGGGLSALQSQILAYPDQGIVIVWAHNNMASNWRRALNRGLTAIALGESYLQPPALAAEAASDPAWSGWWQTESGTQLELMSDGSTLSVGGNGFGLPPEALTPTADGSWVSLDVERVSSLTLSRDASGWQVVLEPEGDRLRLHRSETVASAFVPLDEPTEAALAFARQASAWILEGETSKIWNTSVYRPLRGSESESGWADRCRFIAGRVGTEARLIEEAWVHREGSWRYWRTFEGSGGAVVVMRLEVSADRKVLSFGINPRGSQPESEEKRPVPSGDAARS